MNIEKFAMQKKKAYELWKEYVEACKKNPKDEFLQDMKKIYNQLKSGRKVIDINKVMERGSIEARTFHPKLAICKANATICYLRYDANGTITFSPTTTQNWNWYRSHPSNISLKQLFPELPKNKWDKEHMDRMSLQTMVPKIPASLRPKGQLRNYYILWEVESWEKTKVKEPPRDPYLLRRISNSMFVIIAGWDLTELERSAIRGRVS